MSGPSAVPDHTTSDIASGSKLGPDATKKMDAAVKAMEGWLFNP